MLPNIGMHHACARRALQRQPGRHDAASKQRRCGYRAGAKTGAAIRFFGRRSGVVPIYRMMTGMARASGLLHVAVVDRTGVTRLDPDLHPQKIEGQHAKNDAPYQS